MKDSSLVYSVGVGELSFVAAQVNSRLMVHPAEVFLFVGVLYFLLCSALEQFALWAGRYFRPARVAKRSMRKTPLPTLGDVVSQT